MQARARTYNENEAKRTTHIQNVHSTFFFVCCLHHFLHIFSFSFDVLLWPSEFMFPFIELCLFGSFRFVSPWKELKISSSTFFYFIALHTIVIIFCGGIFVLFLFMSSLLLCFFLFLKIHHFYYAIEWENLKNEMWPTIEIYRALYIGIGWLKNSITKWPKWKANNKIPSRIKRLCSIRFWCLCVCVCIS